MKKTVYTRTFKRGDNIHVDETYEIARHLGLESHFKKIPDPSCSEYGNRNWESLSDIEKRTKGYKLTIIIEEY